MTGGITLILVLALMGINVALVLFGGILLTGVIGLLQGTVDIFTWAKGLGDGMADMFSISMVAILVSGIIGLVRYYGGVEWLVGKITGWIHGRKRGGIRHRAPVRAAVRGHGEQHHRHHRYLSHCQGDREEIRNRAQTAGQPGGYLRLQLPVRDAP